MPKLVVDAGVVLHLVQTKAQVAKGVSLLAPTLLRSQTLSRLHEAVQRGELGAADARAQLKAIGRMPIRLLGDAVLRGRAWELADRLGWASTFDAEYLALTQLQADAFVTLDRKLARQAAKVVTVASLDALVVPSRTR